MNKEKQISGLCQLSSYLLNFLEKNPEIYNEDDEKISSLLRSEIFFKSMGEFIDARKIKSMAFQL